MKNNFIKKLCETLEIKVDNVVDNTYVFYNDEKTVFTLDIYDYKKVTQYHISYKSIKINYLQIIGDAAKKYKLKLILEYKKNIQVHDFSEKYFVWSEKKIYLPNIKRAIITSSNHERDLYKETLKGDRIIFSPLGFDWEANNELVEKVFNCKYSELHDKYGY